MIPKNKTNTKKLIEILTAISLVSKRLATNLARKKQWIRWSVTVKEVCIMELFRHQQETLDCYIKLFSCMRSEQMRTGIFHAVGCALLMDIGCGKSVQPLLLLIF